MLLDLALPIDESSFIAQKDRLNTLLALGYNGCASFHCATNKPVASDSCAIEFFTEEALGLNNDLKQKLRLSNSNPFRGTNQIDLIKQYTRLNIIATETLPEGSVSQSNSATKSYNIISITPRSEKAMQQACNVLDVDIISLELSLRLPFKLRPQLIAQAIRRGILFEIQYASALRDSNSRRNLFTNAQILLRATKGKNLLISSGARNAFELRAPGDVRCLALLMGFTLPQAHEAMTIAESVVSQTRTRKSNAISVKIQEIKVSPPVRQSNRESNSNSNITTNNVVSNAADVSVLEENIPEKKELIVEEIRTEKVGENKNEDLLKMASKTIDIEDDPFIENKGSSEDQEGTSALQDPTALVTETEEKVVDIEDKPAAEDTIKEESLVTKGKAPEDVVGSSQNLEQRSETQQIGQLDKQQPDSNKKQQQKQQQQQQPLEKQKQKQNNKNNNKNNNNSNGQGGNKRAMPSEALSLRQKYSGGVNPAMALLNFKKQKR